MAVQVWSERERELERARVYKITPMIVASICKKALCIFEASIHIVTYEMSSKQHNSHYTSMHAQYTCWQNHYNVICITFESVKKIFVYCTNL